jgi:hypothetical protein
MKEQLKNRLLTKYPEWHQKPLRLSIKEIEDPYIIMATLLKQSPSLQRPAAGSSPHFPVHFIHLPVIPIERAWPYDSFDPFDLFDPFDSFDLNDI